MNRESIFCLVRTIFVLSLLSVPTVQAQSPEEILAGPWEWRNVGPNLAGRSIAACGHSDRPFEYYFGATGGGVWKTTSSGAEWSPVSDGQLNSSSVGAIAVASSDPDIIYVGMGESQLRGNVMQGDGIYVSRDAGKTWTHRGLKLSRTVSRIVVHPSDPNIVWVAVLGDPYQANEERGVFKTEDGGVNWRKVLFRNDKTGAVDLDIATDDPSVLYATFWEVYRNPWKLWSGGAGSSIYKSTDGGETWQDISQNEGLPEGGFGKITVSVSPVDSSRVYLNIEAEQGGLYRSDNHGKSWQLVNGHRDLWQRAFYFLRIQADPVDRDTVYIMNFKLMKSTDAGENYKYIRTPHADVHDMWIDPGNPQRMIAATDGGGVVTVDGGRTWSNDQYSTAQIYRLKVTEDFPYQVCGAMQDNSTWALSPFEIRERSDDSIFYFIGGGENCSVAIKPGQTDIFFSGATNQLIRFDRSTKKKTLRQPYPYMVMGEPANAMPERWNWVYPLVFSKAKPHRLYAGSQHLWESEDEGITWNKISADLTYADPETLQDSGGPIICDQDGPEIYGTLFSIAPSPLDDKLIFTGSDDGKVQVTTDRGNSWKDVTPAELPKHSRIGKIVASKHKPGWAYLAARRYEMGDREPYVFRTKDCGATWTRITNGIADEHFAHVVNEDPQQPGLLYLGTEHGVYVSFDDGDQWLPFQANLPDVHVSGIEAEQRDLIISTHGRGFWIMRNIEPLRQKCQQMAKAEKSDIVRLFKPGQAVRGAFDAAVYYYLPESVGEVELVVKSADGETVRKLNATGTTAGLHRVTWDLLHPGATMFDGMILEGPPPTRGPRAVPGVYTVEMVVEESVLSQDFEVVKDPRLVELTQKSFEEQFSLSVEVRDLISQVHNDVIKIRSINTQLDGLKHTGASDELIRSAEAIAGRLRDIESQLYQVKNSSPKDKIAFPIKLNNRLTGLYAFINTGDQKPTRSFYEMKELLKKRASNHHKALKDILSGELDRLNEVLEASGVPKINDR